MPETQVLQPANVIEALPTEAMVASNAAPTPVELLRIAVSQNADIDKLTKLMDLKERWERNEARKAFVVAMAAFKSDPPKILKNKHVKVEFRAGGSMEYDHATLANVCEAITAGLSKHGISHRWKLEQHEGVIRVTCVLTHEAGHSEETMLVGSPDNSGNKNAIQQIGSTVTYLQRYTLLAACGLAAADNDDDGAPKPELPTEIKRKEPVPASGAASQGSTAPAAPPVMAQSSTPRPAAPPAEQRTAPPPKPPQAQQVRVISEAQARRFYAIRKGTGWSDEETTRHLKSLGINSDREIPVSMYEDLVRWADGKDI